MFEKNDNDGMFVAKVKNANTIEKKTNIENNDREFLDNEETNIKDNNKIEDNKKNNKRKNKKNNLKNSQKNNPKEQTQAQPKPSTKSSTNSQPQQQKQHENQPQQQPQNQSKNQPKESIFNSNNKENKTQNTSSPSNSINTSNTSNTQNIQNKKTINENIKKTMNKTIKKIKIFFKKPFTKKKISIVIITTILFLTIVSYGFNKIGGNNNAEADSIKDQAQKIQETKTSQTPNPSQTPNNSNKEQIVIENQNGVQIEKNLLEFMEFYQKNVANNKQRQESKILLKKIGDSEINKQMTFKEGVGYINDHFSK